MIKDFECLVDFGSVKDVEFFGVIDNNYVFFFDFKFIYSISKLFCIWEYMWVRVMFVDYSVKVEELSFGDVLFMEDLDVVLFVIGEELGGIKRNNVGVSVNWRRRVFFEGFVEFFWGDEVGGEVVVSGVCDGGYVEVGVGLERVEDGDRGYCFEVEYVIEDI